MRLFKAHAWNFEQPRTGRARETERERQQAPVASLELCTASGVHVVALIWIHDLHRLDAEVQADEREDEALQILHEIVEDAQALWVFALLNVEQ